jgi:hypothetical protein
VQDSLVSHSLYHWNITCKHNVLSCVALTLTNLQSNSDEKKKMHTHACNWHQYILSVSWKRYTSTQHTLHTEVWDGSTVVQLIICDPVLFIFYTWFEPRVGWASLRRHCISSFFVCDVCSCQVIFSVVLHSFQAVV